jgi:caffeoyl-CoA O-methyltransferase
MEHLLNPDLQKYILEVTSPEDPLLANLRHETATTLGMINMLSGPIEGKLLQMLVKISNAKNCLEIGTFTGYSALNMAASLNNDGKLITCEAVKEHAQMAQKYFDKSPHGHKIEIRLGDATQTIQSMTDIFDFVFIDADKTNYPVYYDLVLPKCRQGALIVVDNALWRGEVVTPKDNNRAASIDALNRKARNDKSVETVMLSVRDGILLIRKL